VKGWRPEGREQTDFLIYAYMQIKVQNVRDLDIYIASGSSNRPLLISHQQWRN